ncbi:MAG: hypothetical protein PHN18_01865 [Sulfurospirillaceae bacterium]|nr:hypothetical protein [Sulfurospirillaceae bacterium]MDD2826538.1 hypothetical protein [Sulfurospirillaceae bacterium]
MKSIEDIEAVNILRDLCKAYNIQLPNNLRDMKIYKEIQNFKDAEYIYCIAYEMLIRTDEYNALLNEYEPLKNKSKYDMTNDEFSKLRELINRMNELGLKKTSFLGFDCDDDNDHVFKRIEYYDEIIHSPWNVRMLHKFQLDPTLGFNSIFHMLIAFYLQKNALFILHNEEYISFKLQETSQIKFINDILISEINKLVDILFIPYTIEGSIQYRALRDITYLKELDDDFLSQLKENLNNDLLIQLKSNFSYYNTQFWNKYYVNDIKNGLNKLIEFHMNNNLIYDQKIQHTTASKNEILENPSNFYIPCVNRLAQPEVYQWEKIDNLISNNEFMIKLKFDGIQSIVGNKGYIQVIKEEHIYLMQISKYISLSLLDDSFLETLTYEDLENIYIDTEPIFSRPRLMFDAARLTNVPMNLNLSKEDLLLYISQIKDDYDRNKNIVKTNMEYFFDLALESDLSEMPIYIKSANEKRDSKDKRLFPKKREDFKKSLAYAFYIYDLYKFFVPLFEKKRQSIIDARGLSIQELQDTRNIYKINHEKIADIKDIADKELNAYEKNNLITQILYLVDDNLTEEQVKYYLATMKELIHGINKEGENHKFKRQYDPEKKENTNSKYKNLIIGDSYIIKSNKPDLVKIFD